MRKTRAENPLPNDGSFHQGFLSEPLGIRPAPGVLSVFSAVCDLIPLGTTGLCRGRGLEIERKD